MSDDVNSITPWDQGQHHVIGWQLLVTWLTFGAVLNFLQLFLHFIIPSLRKQPTCRIVIWLSSIDFAFDLLCGLQCLVSLYHKKYLGGDLFCILQGLYAELLMTLSACSISCLMFMSYLTIIHNRVLTVQEIDKFHLISIFYCFLISFLGNVLPGRPNLNYAGLFCYTASEYALQGSLFHFGFVIPLGSILFYFWIRIYYRVKAMTKFLAKRKIKVEARKREVRIARRMAWYVCFFFLCFLPYEISLIYSWITHKHPTFRMWIAAGMFAHILTVSNPCLYYILNHTARQIVYDYFYYWIYPDKTRTQSNADENVELAISVSRRGVSIPKDLNTNHPHESKMIEEFVRALSNSSLLNEILAFADSLYCGEGILFWIDVQVWRSMIPDIHHETSRNGAISEDEYEYKREKSVSRTRVMRPIEELRSFALDTFQTYFARGTLGSAPLALNIPNDMYFKIVESLSIKAENGQIYSLFEYSPYLRNVFDTAEKEILGLLYDNVFLPFAAKNNINKILKSQEKLHDLESGNLLPFTPIEENNNHDSEVNGVVDLSALVVPRGEGGVSTGRKVHEAHMCSSSNDKQLTVVGSHNSETPAVPTVGIDASGSFIILKESLSSSPSKDIQTIFIENISSPTKSKNNDSITPSPVPSRQGTPSKKSSNLDGHLKEEEFFKQPPQ